MENKHKYQDDTFIARWIAGDLSDEENDELEQWIKTNPDEKKYMVELKNIWQDYESIKLQQGLSKQERWDKLNQRLCLKSPPNSTTRAKKNWWQAWFGKIVSRVNRKNLNLTKN